MDWHIGIEWLNLLLTAAFALMATLLIKVRRRGFPKLEDQERNAKRDWERGALLFAACSFFALAGLVGFAPRPLQYHGSAYFLSFQLQVVDDEGNPIPEAFVTVEAPLKGTTYTKDDQRKRHHHDDVRIHSPLGKPIEWDQPIPAGTEGYLSFFRPYFSIRESRSLGIIRVYWEPEREEYVRIKAHGYRPRQFTASKLRDWIVSHPNFNTSHFKSQSVKGLKVGQPDFQQYLARIALVKE